MLFEYVIVRHPIPRDKERGRLEELITDEVQLIVAKDLESAKTQALLKLGKDRGNELMEDNDAGSIEVLVRPFK